MASFVLLLLDAPGASQACASAYHFAQACMTQGHQLLGVFLYQDGVYLVQPADIPSDEQNWQHAWQRLAERYHFAIHYCQHAAARRGIVTDSGEAAGLTQLMGQLPQADRVICFG